MAESQFGGVDPADFARAIAQAPDEQLAAGMRSDLRGAILDEIFGRMAEHFDPSRSAALDLVVHFRIEGHPDGEPDRFQVVIRGDVCQAGREHTEPPGLGLTLDAVDFLRLVANQASGMDLYLQGRMNIDGNMMLASRLTGLFAMPDAGRATDDPSATGGR